LRKRLRNSEVPKDLTYLGCMVDKKKMQIPTRRLKKELNRQLMRSGP
jgi:hypothetical protein